MIKIFANKGTSEKIAIFVTQNGNRNMIQELNDKFGGNWIWVDELTPFEEGIKFNDGLVYEGYHESIGRYCKAIFKL